MSTERLDRDYWERRWAQGLREHPDAIAGRRRERRAGPLVAILDGVQLESRAKAFRDGSMLAWFGGIEADLSAAELARRAPLRTRPVRRDRGHNPGDMAVESEVKAVMGGIDARGADDPDAPVLVLEGMAVFGDIEVRAAGGPPRGRLGKVGATMLRVCRRIVAPGCRYFAGGRSTLLMTWMVPLLAAMSVLTTFVDPLRNTFLPLMRIPIDGPASVVAERSFTTRPALTLPLTTW